MKIAFLGDIGLFGNNSVQTQDWKGRFKEIKTILEECDYVIGNLETPLTNSFVTVGGKSAYLKGNPEDVEILKYLGLTHVSLANNHMYDYCEEGVLETIQCLDNNGIKWYGINDKFEEIVTSTTKVRLLGYCCYTTNAVGLDAKNNYINLLDPMLMKKDIENAIEKHYMPILSCHWGEEHVHYPKNDHMLIARELAKKYGIVIHGHHPHVIQGFERIGKSLITYSLGNFCFDDVYTKKSKKPLVTMSKDNQESFVLIIEFKNNEIASYNVIPFFFTDKIYKLADSENDIHDKIKQWSDFLNVSEFEYTKRRDHDLKEYILGRKNNRDIDWYLKRLNFESVKIILNSRKNQKKYYEIMSKFKNSI